MKGIIDDEILNLPNLRILDISNNLFEGQIPATLLSHRSLKTINVSSNLFVGIIAMSCTQIDISRNNFDGTITLMFRARSPISVIDVPVRFLFYKFIFLMNLLLVLHLITLKSHKNDLMMKKNSKILMRNIIQ